MLIFEEQLLYVCPIWNFTFETDQAHINSARDSPHRYSSNESSSIWKQLENMDCASTVTWTSKSGGPSYWKISLYCPTVFCQISTAYICLKNCIDIELCTANEGPVNVFFRISIFTVAWENSWLNCRSREKIRELPPSSGWQQYPALPSAPAVEPRVHKNDQQYKFPIWKITGHKSNQVIRVVNFFLASRLNEIPNKLMVGMYKSLPDRWM